MFPIVDIENVSLKDSFMQYEPETELEKRVKANIIIAKAIGMRNFRKPCMDPSFADDGDECPLAATCCINILDKDYDFK